jgi:hypothetical protein
MTKQILTSVFLIACLGLGMTQGVAQSTDPNLPRTYSVQDHLLILRHSALLVRLPNNQNLIKAYQRAGRTSEIKALKAEIEQTKKDIILAFRQTYTFGKVYFFNDYDHKAVREHNLKGILIDRFEKPVVEAALPNEFLIGAFGSTEQLTLDAFVVMDRNFNQLKSPFPYYQRSNYFLSIFTYSKAEVIEHWNEKLLNKYNQWFSEGIWTF